MEYLRNYGSPETKTEGEKLIRNSIENMTGIARQRAEKLVRMVKEGKDDIYC